MSAPAIENGNGYEHGQVFESAQSDPVPVPQQLMEKMRYQVVSEDYLFWAQDFQVMQDHCYSLMQFFSVIMDQSGGGKTRRVYYDEIFIRDHKIVIIPMVDAKKRFSEASDERT